MREFLWRARKLSILLFVLGLMTVLGCSQSGDEVSSARPATLQQGATEAFKTTGETIASSVDLTPTEQTTRNSDSQGKRQENTRSQPPTRPEKQRDNKSQGDQQDQQKRPPATVRVVGAKGISFVGNLGSGGKLRQVKGTAPEEYQLPVKPGAELVTASIRKQQPQDGGIKVEVLFEGQVVASKESSGPAGMVNIVWTSREQDDG